ncbi:RNA methyltransferase [Streptomyces glebosus]|uniref:site-specific DNA-methyltransferase (adenine-specific) n=2 Tax=Streptomyces glebosus TaxID=249580 RepID=A0A640SXW5_9ACTN|nr:RNA methyltransferase [Streptomyces glebosus]GHG52227.1 RNA methyltransferase [Streptomyces glebosus]
MIEAEVSAATRANRAQRVLLSADGSADVSARALSVLATVPHWWRRRAMAAEAALQQTLDFDDEMAFPKEFGGEGLAELPIREDLLDALPEELADAYVVALESTVRTAEGRHYTPTPLAEILYRQARETLGRRPDGLIWDPACGAGMLLLPALRAWLAERSDAQPDMVIRGVQSAIGGRDLDGAAVWLGNALLAAELLPTWTRIPLSRRKPLPALLEAGDGLKPPPAPPVMTILNPPYGRVRLSDEDRQNWQHVVYGHANRYGLFMAAAVEHLADGGTASALVPAGWLGGSYFQRLRSYLAETAPLNQLSYVSGRAGVFSTGVLQETVLASFRKSRAARLVTCGRVTVNGRAVEEEIGKGRLPTDADQPWLLPRQPEDLPLVKTALKMPRRLADYGWTISTGPLVWNRRKSQLSGTPSDVSVKIVWAADLDGGELHQDPARDRLRYLHLGEKDGRVLVLDRPAVLVQRTTAPEQPRRLLAAALDEETLSSWGSRVSVENHVNVLTCSEPDSLLTPRLLTALLDSDALDRLYRCLTGSVAVSAYELAALPLPGPKTLRSWASLPAERLSAEINHVYGLKP